jgi:hypothetical protein
VVFNLAETSLKLRGITRVRETQSHQTCVYVLGEYFAPVP